jgi:hypothetical protein
MTLKVLNPDHRAMPTSSPPRPGGGGRIRTYEGVSRQIYSLLPLAAWVPLRDKRAAYFDFWFGPCQCIYRAKLQTSGVQIAVHRLTHRAGNGGRRKEVQIEGSEGVDPGADAQRVGHALAYTGEIPAA